MHMRPRSQWPEQNVGSKKLKNACQIQYFVQEEEEEGNIIVNTYAINLLDPRNTPYAWHNVPSHILRLLRVMFWIQWTYGYLYLVKKHNSKLLERYIIYMERIIDGLWAAIESRQVDKWLKEVATPWCVIQKTTSFHSENALEMAIGNGVIKIKDLSGEIRDWDSEGDLLLDMGFPGSDFFDDEDDQRLDRLTVDERAVIMGQLIDHLNQEEGES